VLFVVRCCAPPCAVVRCCAPPCVVVRCCAPARHNNTQWCTTTHNNTQWCTTTHNNTRCTRQLRQQVVHSPAHSTCEYPNHRLPTHCCHCCRSPVPTTATAATVPCLVPLLHCPILHAIGQRHTLLPSLHCSHQWSHHCCPQAPAMWLPTPQMPGM